jgi:hypothetical protein
MEHLAAVLLLVACPADTSGCREESAVQPFFESIEDCRREKQVYAPVSMDGRQILSTCLPVDPNVVFEDAEIIWDVSNGRKLSAEVRLYPDLSGRETS